MDTHSCSKWQAYTVKSSVTMLAGHSSETLHVKMSSSASAEVHQLCGIDGNVPKCFYHKQKILGTQQQSNLMV